MARTDLDKAYRRINERMQKLYETFGTDSPSYQQYATILDINDMNTYYNKKGALQIRTGKANAQLDKFQQLGLNDLLEGGETVGSLRKAAKAYAKEHGLGKSADIDELAQKMDYVKAHRDMIGTLSKQQRYGFALTDTLNDLLNRAAGRSDELSYDELYDLMVAAEGDYNLYVR